MRQPVTVTGLQLPAVSPPEQDKLHAKWDTIEKIERELAMKGFTPMDTPEFECPQISEELLTTADNNLYTQTFARQNSWFNYSSQVLSQVTSYLLQIENEMEMIESKMRVSFREQLKNGMRQKMTKEEMQDEINLDGRYSELKLMSQSYKQRKIQLQAYCEGIDRGLRVISRQVEIRRMENDQNRVNIPGRPVPNGWRRDPQTDDG